MMMMMRDGDERPTSSSAITSVRAMWENNAGGWRTAARRGLAPFEDAHYEDDIQPIFQALIESGIDDVTSPEYTLAFYPRAHELALHAENALLHHGDRRLAAELYLRACAVLRVGRYSPLACSSEEPAESSSPCAIRARAWHLQKSYHTKAGRLSRDSPLDDVLIPHTHDAATRPDESTAGVRDRTSIAAAAAMSAKSKAGPARPQIPAAVRLPPRTLRTGTPCPAVLVVTDDRTSHSRLCGDLVARGWGCVVVEAPGCGDCPVPATSEEASAAAASAAAAPSLWAASVLDWMAAIRVFDMARVVVWAAADAAGLPALVGQLVAAVGGPRVRGCVAVVSGGESAVTMAAGGGWGSNGRVLVVADNNDGKGAAGVEAGAYDAEDDGLVLFEYGARVGGAEQAVRSLAPGAAGVYDWVEDLLRLDLVV